MRTRRTLAVVLAAASVIGLGGCLGGGGDSRESDHEAKTMFEDLIARGKNQPAGIDDFGDENAFSRVEEAYADDPLPGRPVALPDGSGAQGELDEELDVFSELVADASSSDPPLNAYLEFGQSIVWYKLREGDTERLIMKPYTFPVGTGGRIFELLQMYAEFPIFAAVIDGSKAAPEVLTKLGPQPQGTVLLDLREGYSVETYSDPRVAGLRTPTLIPLSDVLFVTAAANELTQVEQFIDLFAAEVRQIEIEAKIVEVTTSESLDLGVKPINDSTPIFGLPNPGGLVKSIDYSFANTSDPSEALFQLGSVFDGVTFNAILEAVASFENVSIISRPKVAVREGARAEIVNVTQIPFYSAKAISASGVPTLSLETIDVGVQMYVIPRVIGRDTVILNIDIEASQETGTGVAFAVGRSIVTVPEISKRNARTIVRLEPGQAVILGGLISERTVERETKVPFLGDIPVLGILFRSKFTSKEQTNVLFFIRPRILEGSDLNSPF